MRMPTEIAAPSGQSNAARKGSARRWRSSCRSAADEERREEIAQRENEGEGRAGEHRE